MQFGRRGHAVHSRNADSDLRRVSMLIYVDLRSSQRALRCQLHVLHVQDSTLAQFGNIAVSDEPLQLF